MSAVPQILSVVRAKYGCVAPTPASEVAQQAAELAKQAAEAQATAAAAAAAAPMVLVNPEIAFYRKYTEALLRRYLRCSMEAGKVPSLMGKEMFRSKVSSYRMKSFEDIIIFMHDVEKCLGRLDEDQQQLIARITLQEYTVQEAAELLGRSPKSIIRHYQDAIDRLTRIFLQVQMLEPKKLVKRQPQEDDE
jgi:predicted transcriptional regulator